MLLSLQISKDYKIPKDVVTNPYIRAFGSTNPEGRDVIKLYHIKLYHINLYDIKLYQNVKLLIIRILYY
jgi:hypothetical protein